MTLITSQKSYPAFLSVCVFLSPDPISFSCQHRLLVTTVVVFGSSLHLNTLRVANDFAVCEFVSYFKAFMQMIADGLLTLLCVCGHSIHLRHSMLLSYLSMHEHELYLLPLSDILDHHVLLGLGNLVNGNGMTFFSADRSISHAHI